MMNASGRPGVLLAVLLPVLLLPACGTSETIRTQNSARLERLQPGMSRSEVLAVMGTGPAEATTERPPFVPVQIDNPYRRDTFEADGSAWEVLYYLTTLRRVDNAITLDELTPIVLRDGVLVGWGQAFWDEQVREYEIALPGPDGRRLP